MSTRKFSLTPVEELAGGDNEFIKELITVFLGQIQGFISNMNNYFHDNDLKNLAKEAHTAKSSVLIFGMEQTSLYLKKIQKLAEENDTNKILELIQLAEKDLTETAEELEMILKNQL